MFLYTTPFFVALGAYRFLGERLRSVQWAGMVVSFAGVAAAIGVPQPDVDAKVLIGDLMIVAGTVNLKMADRVRRLYNQMPDPKFVIAMGACTCGGGPYYKYGYNVAKGVDLVVPVDVYVPGCPPRPEALVYAVQQLQKKVRGEAFDERGTALPMIEGWSRT